MTAPAGLTARRRRPAALLVALALLAWATSARADGDDRATATHRFDDVPYWTKVFDDPRRDAWQKPAELVAALRVPAGATVVDLGAGTGYFEPYLSRAVGTDGSVLAVEVEPRLVEWLRDRAERDQLANVTPVLASLGNPRLPRAVADLIFIADTYHHLDHRRRYLPQLARALRPAGRVAIVDWKPGELPEGPEPSHKLAPETVIGEMRDAGFTLVAQPDILPYHYVLVFGGGRSPSR
ncbi:class I SAM-dependent methyltransferase [bacterium]|nr:class I SAM-dependent methyltransferase [bacterium]